MKKDIEDILSEWDEEEFVALTARIARRLALASVACGFIAAAVLSDPAAIYFGLVGVLAVGALWFGVIAVIGSFIMAVIFIGLPLKVARDVSDEAAYAFMQRIKRKKR